MLARCEAEAAILRRQTRTARGAVPTLDSEDAMSSHPYLRAARARSAVSQVQVAKRLSKESLEEAHPEKESDPT